MTADPHRSVSLRRTAAGRFVASNGRGGEMSFGADPDGFTPIEALLAAIGACTALDVDALTSRRGEPDSFEVEVGADKVRDEAGNRLENVTVVFRVTFPTGAPGDAARAVLPDMVAKSHDRLCTVSRTVEAPTPIATHIE